MVRSVAKHMARSRQYIVGMNCVKDLDSEILIESDQ